MTDHRQTTTPGHAGRAARFRADESGASRVDRVFFLAGGGIVAALALFLLASNALDGTEDTAEAPSEAPARSVTRTVTAGPMRAPDPPPVDGAEASRVFVAHDYSELVSHGADREAQILDDELARVRATEAAVAAAAAAAEGAEGADAESEAPPDGS